MVSCPSRLFRTLAALAVVALSLFVGAPLQAGQITIKGSDTMVILCQRWAEAYMRNVPGVNVEVSGGGSGTGIAALQAGTTDLCASSRPIKPKEIAEFVVAHGAKPLEFETALDGLAVYVHESNPIRSLSFEQVAGIFTGSVRNWADVGGARGTIVLYSRENNSGTYAFFKEHVLKDKDFAATAQNMAGTAALINAVANDPSGIGYGGIAYAKGARAVAIAEKPGTEPVEPLAAKVSDGSYPLSRFLFFYSNPKKMTPDVQHFLTWVQGSEGQEIVAAVEYIPLPGKGAATARAGSAADAVAAAASASPSSIGATPRAPSRLDPDDPNLPPFTTQIAESFSRDDLLARREQLVAEREALLAIREAKVLEREAALAKREVGSAAKK